MSDTLDVDPDVWKKKAIAFVTRSHRHLWGKNNEDPLAFLFTQGLKNQFVKDRVLGWNKFGQERPMENWGFPTDPEAGKKLYLPSGLVIPFIVEKDLKSVFIHSYDENNSGKTVLVEGSQTQTLVLGKKKERVAVVHHIFDGLFLFQESCETCCVVIHPNPAVPLEDPYLSMVKAAASAFIFSSEKKETDWNRNAFPFLPDHCFLPYHSKEELKNRCLGN